MGFMASLLYFRFGNLQHLAPAATAAAKSLQSCLILCDLIDDSPPGSSVPGILQARILEWVAISFSYNRLDVQEMPFEEIKLGTTHSIIILLGNPKYS